MLRCTACGMEVVVSDVCRELKCGCARLSFARWLDPAGTFADSGFARPIDFRRNREEEIALGRLLSWPSFWLTRF